MYTMPPKPLWSLHAGLPTCRLSVSPEQVTYVLVTQWNSCFFLATVFVCEWDIQITYNLDVDLACEEAANQVVVL